MTTIEKTGPSIEKLISEFRSENKIKDWELKYDIVKKPSSGFLGLFGSKVAVVSFNLPDIGERAAAFLDKLLQKMGVPFDGIEAKSQGKTVYLEIKGSKDSGFLIGKNGNMLETLQYFVNRIYESDRGLDRIYLDCDGYRERRESIFLRQFLPLIKQVKDQGKPYTMDPMNAADRRIIHRHIERDRGLRTLTIGEGEKKRIVIFSSKQSESEVLSQTGNKASRRPPRRTNDRKN